MNYLTDFEIYIIIAGLRLFIAGSVVFSIGFHLGWYVGRSTFDKGD